MTKLCACTPQEKPKGSGLSFYYPSKTTVVAMGCKINQLTFSFETHLNFYPFTHYANYPLVITLKPLESLFSVFPTLTELAKLQLFHSPHSLEYLQIQLQLHPLPCSCLHRGSMFLWSKTSPFT